MSTREILVIALGMLLMTAVAAYFLYRMPPPSSAENFSKEFSLKLANYAGKDVSLYEYRRHVIIAYAWASWCSYCGEELTRLVELKKSYGDKVQILAINRAEPAATAQAFTDALGISGNITLLLDPSDSFFKSIGGYAMPETVFIDKNGDMVFHQRGPLQMSELKEKIQTLVQ